MSGRQFGTDLTVGSIPRHLLRFSLPMLLGNLIQIGYSIVNTIWVGHLVGENAVGASGVTFPVIFVIIGLAMGLAMATTILVSQYYGAKDYGMVEKVVNNSFSLSLIIGAALTISGMALGDTLLKLMKAPPENFAMASSYLRISLAGTVLIFLMFLTTSILRGIGDTVTPLSFMAVGIGLNAVLDPFFIGGFGPFPSHGLNGAAYAALVSQATALGIGIIYLNRKNHIVAFNPRKLILDGPVTWLIFKIGLPSVVQQSLVSMGHMFIVTFVNSFGSAATNAFGAVGRVDMFAFMPAMSVAMAVSALTGQNLGARKPKRVKEIFRWGIVMTTCITVTISLVAVLLSGIILKIFGLGDDAKVMDVGITYLRTVGSCYVLVGVMLVAGGVINGSGHTLVTMIVSILGFWLVRVPAAWFLSKTGLGITGIWVGVMLGFATGMVLTVGYYFSGRWKKAVIVKAVEAIPFMD